MSSSEEEEQTYIDDDTCDVGEIAKSFKITYSVSSEEAVSLKKDYILHLNNSRLDSPPSGTLNLNSMINKTDLNSSH